MFDDLSTAQRNQYVEVCRYFFRATVMKKHLEELVVEHGGFERAVDAEWDRYWAYYSYWLAGLWVTCEGIDRVSFGDEELLRVAKQGLSLLHPVRQATFHFKPNTAQMERHFDSLENADLKVWDLHDMIEQGIAEFLASLPDGHMKGLERS